MSVYSVAIKRAGATAKWIISGAVAWIKFRPGSRPRRVLRQAAEAFAEALRARPRLRKAVGALASAAPPLKRRLKSIAQQKYSNVVFPDPNLLQERSPGPAAFNVQAKDNSLKRLNRQVLFFVGHTVSCSVNTGVQRVTRGLAAGLLKLGRAPIFVKWDEAQGACVLINAVERAYLGRWNGPAVSDVDLEIYPPANASPESFEIPDGIAQWLIVPEAPHINSGHMSVTGDIIRWAKSSGCKAGSIFYDAIPLSREEFAETAAAHRQYMLDLASADAVWPISDWSGEALKAHWASELGESIDNINSVKSTSLPADTGIGPRYSGAFDSSAKTILCVGTLEPRKNQVALIRAFQKVVDENSGADWKLLLVGNLHSNVAADVNKAKNKHIKHLGIVSDEELTRLYEGCAFTVFPSVEEGFGLPIFESLWFGKPCLCANFGAMAEIAREGGCMMVDVRDQSALEAALRAMISDVSLRQRLAAEAQARKLESWADYAFKINAEIESNEDLLRNIGPIYYWIDSTRKVIVNTGIQRVVRQTARSLIELGAEVIPAVWNGEDECIAPAQPEHLEYLAMWNGPQSDRWAKWRDLGTTKGGWFVMGELPLDFTPIQQNALLAHAARSGLKTAAIFYDAIPAKLEDIYPASYAAAHKDYMLRMAAYDLVLSISKFSRDDLTACISDNVANTGNLDDRIKAVLLPGEFSRFERVKNVQAPATSDAVSILCVGSVEPRKNHKVLLAAFAAAKEQSARQLKLVLAGRADALDPDLEGVVQSIVDQDPDIEWVRDADDARLKELYAAADFTVYPSYEEGFGLPILESLWNGKPCICANFGAMAEVVEEGGGCLSVDVGDADVLAGALARLADDRELRLGLEAEAAKRAFKTWGEYAAEFADALAAARAPNHRLTPKSARPGKIS